MQNTIQRKDTAKIVFNKLRQVKIQRAFNTNTDNILFIGDDSTLAYIQDNLVSEDSSLNCLSFDIENVEASLNKIDEYKNNFAGDKIVVASIEHEKYIYTQIKDKFRQQILSLFDDIFINLVIKRKIFDSIPTELNPPQTNYCILSTPRSGSTMLCDALISTELAGFPLEHLREPSLVLAKHCNFSSDRYLKALMSLHTTKNSVFGTKLISHFVERYIKLSKGEFDPLSYFSNFIYLVRQDKIAQAVSLFMAQRSGVWHINESQKLSKYQDKIDNDFISDADLEKVDHLYHRLLKEEEYLQRLCDQKNISPMIVVYEELEQNLSSNIREILCYLNIIDGQYSSPINVSVSKKKLSSGLSNKVIDLYKKKFS